MLLFSDFAGWDVLFISLVPVSESRLLVLFVFCWHLDFWGFRIQQKCFKFSWKYSKQNKQKKKKKNW